MKQWIMQNKYILAVAVLLLLLVWPVGVFKDETISRTAADLSDSTDPIGLVLVLEEFIPQHDTIKTLGVDIGKLGGKANEGNIRLIFYDENLAELASYTYPVQDMKDGELTDIPVNMKLKAGNRYFFSLQCEDYGETAPVVHYRNEERNAPVEHLHFYYGPTVIDGAVANMRFTYAVPLHLSQILFYDSFVIFAMTFVAELLKRRKHASEDTN